MKLIYLPDRGVAFHRCSEWVFFLLLDGRLIHYEADKQSNPIIVTPCLTGEYPYWPVITDEGVEYWSCHRTMAETFLPNPNNLPVVNHKDGNKLNWQLSNLEWCTQSDNINHAHRLGLTHATPQDTVIMIKKLHDEGKSIQAISTETGVKYQTVWDILHGKRHAGITL